MSTLTLWKRYQQYLCPIPHLGLTLDVSRMRFDDGFLDRMAPWNIWRLMAGSVSWEKAILDR